MRWILALLCGGALVACNPVADAAKELNASGAPTGEFSGELLVLWLDDGDQNTGSGRFAFVPAPKARLSFTRPVSTGYETAIRPERFYTDGGSVPRLAQVFRGFNPWAYGPAYAVHDWIFVANSCRKDGKVTPEEAKHAEMDFDDSQQIMLETIATLMEI